MVAGGSEERIGDSGEGVGPENPADALTKTLKISDIEEKLERMSIRLFRSKAQTAKEAEG